jgi:Ca-activated chloride channel homolog
MGRHATADEDDLIGSSGLGLTGRLALVAAAVVTVVGAGVLLGPREALARLPWASDDSCTTVNVDMVVSPELQSVVSQIVEPVRGKKLSTAAGEQQLCAGVQVRGQEPQETAASSDILPIDRAPQLWIPDGSNWADEAKQWPATSQGSLATTPVVIGASKAAVAALGWDKRNPTWRNVLRSDRTVAVPDYQAQSESLDMLIALWTTQGKTPSAEKLVVQTVLASDRQEVPSPEDAIATARSGSSRAPLIPTTEQNIAALNASSQEPNLVAVYPKEGSPRFDYPILSIDKGSTQTAADLEATQDVITELKSARAQGLLRAAGFRDNKGDTPAGAGIRPDYTLELERPKASEVDGMIGRIDNLARPSRILTLIDASNSMREKLDDGIPRMTLAGAAARLGANLLPDSAYVGAWIFATKIDGDQDYKVLADVKRLGSQSPDGDSYRSYLVSLASDVDKYLSPGGTALYDATDAAFADMHKNYDPKASNAIILMTDGSNQDPGSISLDQLLAHIRDLNKGKEKVAIFTAAVGRDADSSALKEIADASGGHTYIINNAQDGQRALLDGLRRNHDIGIG